MAAVCITLALAAASSAQTCDDVCQSIFAAATVECSANYATCVDEFPGDPDHEVLCRIARDECRDRALEAFIACLVACNSACGYDCNLGHGYLIAACFQAYAACLHHREDDPVAREKCLAALQGCNASADRWRRECILETCPPVALRPLDWGRAKLLYR
jgi:hypothetical protein